MVVIIHGYGWFGGGRDGGGGWYACGTKPVGWSHVVRCQNTSRARGDTLVAPRSRCSALGRVEPELVGLPGKALTRDLMNRLTFIVNAARAPRMLQFFLQKTTIFKMKTLCEFYFLFIQAINEHHVNCDY